MMEYWNYGMVEVENRNIENGRGSKTFQSLVSNETWKNLILVILQTPCGCWMNG